MASQVGRIDILQCSAPRGQIGESVLAVHAVIKPQRAGGLKVYLPRQTKLVLLVAAPLLRQTKLGVRSAGLGVGPGKLEVATRCFVLRTASLVLAGG